MTVKRDVSGQTFGMLKVLERLPNNDKGTAIYKCECLLCHSIIERSSSIVIKFHRDGMRPNCGCHRKKRDIWEKL
jgi:hypothetical protein